MKLVTIIFAIVSATCYQTRSMKNNLLPKTKHFIVTIFSIVALIGCNDTKTKESKPTTLKQAEEIKPSIQVDFKVNLNTPTVGINHFTLITNDLQRDSANAQAILRAKVILPLAMQRHDESLFESVLSKDFVSQGEDEFFNRKEYIQDRVSGKWTIWDVQYENLVLEFFDDIAVLTYRNTVKEKDEAGKQQIYHWTWTDIWVKENGNWKIKVLRAID